MPLIELDASRGTILHKLMEEALTGETQDTAAELERRATELLIQLGRKPSLDPTIGIAPKELAATIIRTLTLPEIAALRPCLVPELTVFGSSRWRCQLHPDLNTKRPVRCKPFQKLANLLSVPSPIS